MKNGSSPRYTSQELSTKITAHIRELVEATDTARISEEMTRYLDTCARFHKYSSHNVWMILMSRPEATLVAGYQK